MEALIVIDMQNDYFPGGRFPLKGIKKAAKNAQRLVERFRAEGKPVVFVRHESIREGSAFFLPGTGGAEFHPSLLPANDDIVILKHYPNSFRETGLTETLKGLGVTELHVAGAMTNMCVDSTVRAAFDFGFAVTLHGSACAARGFLGTPLVHVISLKTLGAAFATVTD